MNRTFAASLVLALAILTLVVHWFGAQKGQEASKLRIERELLQEERERLEEEERARSSRRLALTYRLKRVSGQLAQEEAVEGNSSKAQALRDDIQQLKEEILLLDR
ncbi:MAG: hypothetical protein AAF191_11670 [Verrucomicrobiota bacterium]